MPLASDPNAVDYQYPAYILTLVDEWGSGYAVLLQGFGGPADDGRVRDMLAGLTSQNRVNWSSCRKVDRATEQSAIFEQLPPELP